MLPFLMALCLSSTSPNDKLKLHRTAAFYDVPLFAMKIMRYLVALFFIVYFMSVAYSSLIGWLVGVGCFICILIFASTKLVKQYHTIENKFISNLNMRENMRMGVGNNLVDDMHQAFIEINNSCPFVGDKLRDSGLRSDYGVSVSSIQRGDDYMPLPSPDARIFPGDTLGIIGNDEQLRRLNQDLDNATKAGMKLNVTQQPVELNSIQLAADSPIIGMPLSKTDLLHDYYSMLVKIKRGDTYFQPRPDAVLQAGDILWVVGDPRYVENMKSSSQSRK